MYSWLTYNHKSDFIGPAGAVEVHLLSNAPQETPKYETIFSPFDRYVWAFSLASLGAVTMALLIIDKIHATWSRRSSKGESLQGKPNYSKN